MNGSDYLQNVAKFIWYPMYSRYCAALIPKYIKGDLARHTGSQVPLVRNPSISIILNFHLIHFLIRSQGGYHLHGLAIRVDTVVDFRWFYMD